MKLGQVSEVNIRHQESLAEDFLFTRIRLNVGCGLFRSKLLKKERFDEKSNLWRGKRVFFKSFL